MGRRVAGMSLFQRVLNYLVNEVIVQGLANSRTFQRFAVRTDATLNELKNKGTQHHSQLSDQASSFFKTFRKEVSKGIAEHAKQQRPPTK